MKASKPFLVTGLVSFTLIPACTRPIVSDDNDAAQPDATTDIGVPVDDSIGFDSGQAADEVVPEDSPSSGTDVVAFDAPDAFDAPADDMDVTPIEPLDVPLDDASDADGSSAAISVCTGMDIELPAEGGESRFPTIAWTGRSFAIAWQESLDGNLDVHVARVTPDGAVSEDLRVTSHPSDDTAPSIAWDGTNLFVAWARLLPDSAIASIRVARLGPDTATGQLSVAEERAITDAPSGFTAGPSLVAVPASAGSGLAVAWEDGRNGPDNHEIYFQRIDPTGAQTGPNIRITNAPRTSYSPILRWNARLGELGLVWLDDRDNTAPGMNEELYFARLRADGSRPVGTGDIRLTTDPHRSIWPSFTYDSAGFAIEWANETDVPDRPQIFFGQRNDDGAPRAGAVVSELISTNPPDIGAWTTAVGWNGAEYLAVWESQQHPNGDLLVRRFAANGTPLTDGVFVDDDTFFSAHPMLTWNGTTWAVTWEDDRNVHRSVFVRLVGRAECLR